MHPEIGRKFVVPAARYSEAFCHPSFFLRNMIFIFMPFFPKAVHSSSFSTPHLKYSVKRFRDYRHKSYTEGSEGQSTEKRVARGSD